MITSSPQETLDLLNKWRDEGRWLGVQALFEPTERHDFWAKIPVVSSERFILAGKYALVEFPLGPDTKGGYLGGAELPPEVHNKMDGGVEFCFCIRSHSVSVLLFGAKPKYDTGE